MYDYTQQLDDIEDSIQGVGQHIGQIESNTYFQMTQLESIERKLISGDFYVLNNKIEKLNTSINLVAIILAFALIYNFIVRSLK